MAAKVSSLWFEKGPHGVRLTETAREIYELGRQCLASIAPGQAKRLEQCLEENFLAVFLDGAPLDVEALRGVLTPARAKLLKDLFTCARSRPHSLQEFLSASSDAEIIDLIRRNPRWAEFPTVAQRNSSRRSAAPAEARAWTEALSRKNDAPHRPAKNSKMEMAARLRERERDAGEIQRAYFTLRDSHPGDTLLELGRRLYEILEGTPSRRILQSGVKHYLAGLGAVVRSKDGDRFVSIEDPGWPRAVALASISKELGVTAKTLLKALAATRS